MKLAGDETVKLMDGKKLWCYAVSHLNNSGSAVWFTNEMEQITGQKPKFISPASPVLGAHTGPGVVALGVLLEYL